jgi:hypothetical protein
VPSNNTAINSKFLIIISSFLSQFRDDFVDESEYVSQFA